MERRAATASSSLGSLLEVIEEEQQLEELDIETAESVEMLAVEIETSGSSALQPVAECFVTWAIKSCRSSTTY